MSNALKAGDQVHVLAGSWNIRTGGHELVPIVDVLARGATLTITAQLLELNDWLAVTDPDEQIARWGQQVWGKGPWPSDTPTWRHGSPEWAQARETARRDAWSRPEGQREEALREVERVYGTMKTSQTLGSLFGGRPVDSNPTPRFRGDAA